MTNNRAPRGLIAANWKMNGLRADGLALAENIAERARKSQGSGPEILICPPFHLLIPVAEVLQGSGVLLGGQDCFYQNSGAFTGDISPAMLKDAGCSHVIVGHSERRSIHREKSGEVRTKAEAANAAGLVAVICIGETEAQREEGRALDVVGRQIAESVPPGSTPTTLIVAYEPIWAIGTGRVPTNDDIMTMHLHIRSILSELIEDGHAVRLLYGGSVKGSNASSILAVPSVDGALVGGASLNADEYWSIVSVAPQR